ncbi:MAG TPA: PEP-CTERM sorting domain-containing protein, partial [Oceanipulchritudo sp.]|nr:PEP-CTERM sorting domain-containing protein [Oceanipulchritudo sp.]
IFAPAGGSAINEALPDVNQNSQFRLNLASPITDPGSVVYVSWLGKRNGAPATAADGNNGLTPGKYADNPYPRPSGVRFLQTASGNSASGNIEWSSSGNPLSSTHMGWGAWAWNDTHGLMPAGTPDAVDVVDFVVVRLDYTTSRVTWWVNPQLDGSSDGGPMSFIWTDGGTPKVMNLYAFGTEAGSGNAERSPGSWQFDEIRVASTFEEAAGFVPEPSTYAAVLGLLAMGFVWMRRRRK